MLKLCLPVSALVIASPTSLAQLAQKRVMAGDTVTIGQDELAVLRCRGVSITPAGYFATVLDVGRTHPPRERSVVWGGGPTSPGSVLLAEDQAGTGVASFKTTIGTDGAGLLVYGGNSLPAPHGFLDSSWAGSSQLAIEGQPAGPSFPNMYWRSVSSTGLLTTGDVVWRGGLTDVPGGTGRTISEGIFRLSGSTLARDLGAGDAIANAPASIRAVGGLSPYFEHSPSGTHLAAIVYFDTGDLATDQGVVLDGAVLQANGQPLLEGGAVPFTGAPAGEVWDKFHLVVVNDAGDWALAGRGAVNRGTPEEELSHMLVVNGVLAYRDGDHIGLLPYPVVDQIDGLAINAQGDVAYLWGLDKPAGEDFGHVLFVNDLPVAQSGDGVDLDGDGAADPDWIIHYFSEIDSLRLSDRYEGGGATVFARSGLGSTAVGPLEAVISLSLDGVTALGCEADLNRDGKVDILDMNMFQDLFIQQDPAADLDGNGVWDIFDFNAFNDLFVQGC